MGCRPLRDCSHRADVFPEDRRGRPRGLGAGRDGWWRWKSATKDGSRTSAAGTQLCSSGPNPSQSTRYWRTPPLLLESRSLRTAYVGAPSTQTGEGGAAPGNASSSGPGITGLSSDTWKVGHIRHWGGNASLYVTSLILLTIRYGPMYFGLSFLHPPGSLRSLVESHTRSPGEYTGVLPRCLSACSFCR